MKIRCTCATKILCSPTFALISNFATKVMMVCLFNHCSYLALLRCKHHFTTNVTNYVEVIYKNTNKLQRKVLNRRRLKLNLVGHFQLLKLFAFDHFSRFSNNLEMIHQNHTFNSSWQKLQGKQPKTLKKPVNIAPQVLFYQGSSFISQTVTSKQIYAL